jgi:serine protease Do
VELEILRNQQVQTIALQVSEMKDAEPAPEPAGSRFGLTLEALTKDLAKQYNLSLDAGVVVTNVETGSPAARDGLRKGDVILEVERMPVPTLETFRDTVRQLNLDDHVLLLIGREGRSFFTVLHAARG